MTSTSSFEEGDLAQLNTLFGKLGQPPAEFVKPELFDSIPDPHEVIIQNLSEGNLTRVFEVVRPGVLWRHEILQKAVIEGCSADFVAIVRSAENSTVAEKLREALDVPAARSLLLSPTAIEEVLDLKGLRREASRLFEELVKSHPDRDFFIETVAEGERYVQRKMRVNGTTQPGQYCEVVEMTHGGLCRRSDPDWRIKAFVTIRNVDVNERDG